MNLCQKKTSQIWIQIGIWNGHYTSKFYLEVLLFQVLFYCLKSILLNQNIESLLS
jgi:hypothetical protein